MKFLETRWAPFCLVVLALTAGGEGYGRSNEEKKSESAFNCSDLISSSAKSLALGRYVGQQVTQDSLKHWIAVLSGDIPLPDGEVLKDRYTQANRIRTRRYLVSKLGEFGFAESDIEIEASLPPSPEPHKSKSKKKKKKHHEDGDRDSGRDKDKEESEDDAELSTEAEKLASAADLRDQLIQAEMVNICATVRGSKYPNEVIEISAHYDTVFEGAPGADDNGSGVATVLEVARAIRWLNPERTVRIVFADLEERGRLGTTMHVKRLKDRKDEEFLGAIVVDTIGFFPQSDSDKPKFVVEVGEKYHHRSDDEVYERSIEFANSVLDQMKAYSRHAEGHIALSDALPGTADHGPYWEKGYPAVLIAAFYKFPYINPGYHKSSDQAFNIDWVFFHSIAQQVVEAASRMGKGKMDFESIAELFPSPEFIAANRNHVSLEVARLEKLEKIAQEKRRIERVAFEAKQKEERRLAEEKLAKDRELWKSRRQDPTGVDHLKWSFKDLNFQMAEYLGIPIERKTLWSSLVSIFTGASNPAPTSMSQSQKLPLMLLEPQLNSSAAKIRFQIRSDLGGRELELRDRNIAKHVKRTVEILFTPGEYWQSSAKVRIGELVFSIQGSDLIVRKYSPSEMKGLHGVVFFLEPENLELLQMRFCRYLSFMYERGGVRPLSSDFWTAGHVEMGQPLDFGSVYPAFDVRLSLKIAKGNEKQVWFVEEQNTFRMPVKLQGTSDAERALYELEKGYRLWGMGKRPSLLDFGVSAMRDVMGIEIPIDKDDATWFRDFISNDSARVSFPLRHAFTEYISRSALSEE